MEPLRPIPAYRLLKISGRSDIGSISPSASIVKVRDRLASDPAR